ncbi:zinc-binding alcohol dehydrogenase domain-containing protein [Colletotrichum tofieldiae]|uniref:Zinc-binding alcohol dehydrogenase domain-containing protein n=1 Tax=Colletotrichum tofieldiae TaxID=708197 RepID=A0A166R5V2_9PEZI|nr:zinc-binding alcohol dehydrogenase domain-containing protein [Colletotrichum tofieldiae]GKT58227.1 zinc-binding alcohol dehydrogenase domain-containing protein [Colletotrichum tofieldiae]GKT79729.1 zinc-binding alcohol dehydrogenase domain-containing protein [Colletotrichum tofieldiae]GKT84303.1 zinc-binding alcohol dehydrogenase domain-containing protein [Colletotrichum tofieldiae]
MPHSAAVQSAPKAPLEVQDVETPQLGPHELLINNELIALVPIDAKQAKLAIFPIEYPAILGTSYGGTIAAVGSEATNFKVGDKVAAVKTAGVSGNKYSGFQKYVVSRDVTASKVPESIDLRIPVGLIGNFSTIVGLFNEHLGLERPDPVNKVPLKGKTILIYGGTSSFGSFATQYVTQAGYKVVTTTSPQHKDFVAKLGAVHVVDHTQSHDAVVKELVAHGPYDYVVDSISLKPTFDITAEVVAAQGGGKLYALLPPPEPSSFPKSVAAEFGSWSVPLGQEKNAELLKWAFGTYFTQAVTNDRIVALPSQKIDGGLGGLNKAVDVLFKGVSGAKVVVEP